MYGNQTSCERDAETAFIDGVAVRTLCCARESCSCDDPSAAPEVRTYPEAERYCRERGAYEGVAQHLCLPEEMAGLCGASCTHLAGLPSWSGPCLDAPSPAWTVALLLCVAQTLGVASAALLARCCNRHALPRLAALLRSTDTRWPDARRSDPRSRAAYLARP